MKENEINIAWIKCRQFNWSKSKWIDLNILCIRIHLVNYFHLEHTFTSLKNHKKVDFQVYENGFWNFNDWNEKSIARLMMKTDECNVKESSNKNNLKK